MISLPRAAAAVLLINSPLRSFLCLRDAQIARVSQHQQGLDCSSPGLSILTLSLLPGYWRANVSSTIIRKCLNEVRTAIMVYSVAQYRKERASLSIAQELHSTIYTMTSKAFRCECGKPSTAFQSDTSRRQSSQGSLARG